jgi:hypothetical protein
MQICAFPIEFPIWSGPMQTASESGWSIRPSISARAASILDPGTDEEPVFDFFLPIHRFFLSLRFRDEQKLP